MTTLITILCIIGVCSVLRTLYKSKSGKVTMNFLIGLTTIMIRPVKNLVIIAFFAYLIYGWLF